MANQNHLILGGCGFVGTNLALFLSEKGINVKVLDDFSNSPFYNETILKVHKIEVVHGSVFSDITLKKSFENQDVVYNFVSSGYHLDGFENAENLLSSQTISTQMAIQAASNFDVKRLIIPSSLHVYGNPKKYRSLLCEEDQLNPLNPIGCTNKCVETIVETFSSAYKIPVTIIRFGELFGKYMNIFSPYSSLATLARDIFLDYLPLIPFDGEHSVDYTSVDDACSYLFLLSQENSLDNFTYNLCSGEFLKINDLFDKIFSFYEKNHKDKLIHERSLRPYVFHLAGDSSKLKEKFGDFFSDKEEKIIETLSWIREMVQNNKPVTNR